MYSVSVSRVPPCRRVSLLFRPCSVVHPGTGIDDVRVYSVALSAAQARTLAVQSCEAAVQVRVLPCTSWLAQVRQLCT